MDCIHGENTLANALAYGLVVKTVDYTLRNPWFKTSGLLQGHLDLSSFQGR